MSADYFWSAEYRPRARRVVLLRGCPDEKKHRLLLLLTTYLEQNGQTAERYSAPLRPEQAAAVFLPESGVLFIDSHFAQDLSADAELSLDEQRDWAELCRKSAAIAKPDEKIQECERKYSRFFNAAALLQKDFARTDAARLNKAKLTRCAVRLAAKEFPPPSGRIGRETRRMLTSHSAGGMAAHFRTIAEMCDTLILLEDFSGAAGAFLLSRLRANALGNGLDAVVCPSPLDPNGAPEFLFVPELRLGAAVCNRFHNPHALIAALEGGKRFEHMRVLRSERFYLRQGKEQSRRLRFLHRAQWELLEAASAALAAREQLLERLAGYYAAADGTVNLPMLAAKALLLGEIFAEQRGSL
ncbi:MAG: hypothetical protein LBT21_07070 [Oscillospiraceae bacterium]|nr:hypothetical protein [Oscillospiraceae bacterium]